MIDKVDTVLSWLLEPVAICSLNLFLVPSLSYPGSDSPESSFLGALAGVSLFSLVVSEDGDTSPLMFFGLGRLLNPVN